MPDNPITMNRPTGSIFSKRALKAGRQQPGQHPAAVERRNGQQIEHGENHIDHDTRLRHERDPTIQGLVAVDSRDGRRAPRTRTPP